MPKFRFTLESVLKLRDQKRDECRRQLGLAVSRLSQIEQIGEQLVAAQDDLRGYLKELSQQKIVPVGMVSRCHMHLAQLERKYQQVLVAKSEARQMVEFQRVKLVEADQQVKVMEKLRDKQWEDHQREQDRRERLEQEEVQAAYQGRKLFS